VVLDTNNFANSLGSGSFSITTNATDLILKFNGSPSTQPPTNFVSTAPGQGTFNGSPNTVYTVQYTDSLDPISWQTLTNVTTDGTGLGGFTDPSAPNGQPQRFYRVKNP
jgi:hypothetical protein